MESIHILFVNRSWRSNFKLLAMEISCIPFKVLSFNISWLDVILNILEVAANRIFNWNFLIGSTFNSKELRSVRLTRIAWGTLEEFASISLECWVIFDSVRDVSKSICFGLVISASLVEFVVVKSSRLILWDTVKLPIILLKLGLLVLWQLLESISFGVRGDSNSSLTSLLKGSSSLLFLLFHLLLLAGQREGIVVVHTLAHAGVLVISAAQRVCNPLSIQSL